MIELASSNILLRAKAGSKEEAIRLAGHVLLEGGFIAPGYIESMLTRELQANTFLGNGIAISRGHGKDRELIHRPGVSVVQFPEGVEWNAGQSVRLVVGIAAHTDEHLSVLAALTEVLEDPTKVDRLAHTDDPAEVIAALSGVDGASATPAEESLPGAQHVDVKIVGAAGLHARPATAFVETALRFSSEIRVQHGATMANGKAMASLLKMGVAGGETIRLIAAGPDAALALAALKEAVETGLGEQEVKEELKETRIWHPEAGGREIAGVAAAPGLAIGPLFQFQTSRIVIEESNGDPVAEKHRLEQAIELAYEQLGEVHDAVRRRLGKNEAAIFRAHQALLTDEDLLVEVRAQIDTGHSAAWAWQRAMDERVAEVQRVSDTRLAARSTDLHDVAQRVLRILAGIEHGEPRLPEVPVILIADDLTPSETARLDPTRILGICTAAGGPTSHTAIIAHSLGIPAVVGASPSVLELASGMTCILDAGKGSLYLDPSAADLQSARAFQRELARQHDADFRARYQPAILTDGHRVGVVANIGKVAEAGAAVEAGAEGIGLLRTEFLFLERTIPPTEEEQVQAYSAMTRALNGLPLTIRTLDIGGDKLVPYLSLPKEENPFLGIRGIRLCLRKPELFLPQLRAIYRASLIGPVKIMFPMIATLEDLRAAKAGAETVRRELGAPPVEIGIMVEVPSAVMLAPELARECDFFSIGTNDLTQYALAMDRMHPALAQQVDGLHPAVLRLIDHTVRAAKAAGKWVGVCGGVAGDPLGASILAGMGVSELSMSIPSIAGVKAHLRTLPHSRTKALAGQALACSTAEEVRALA